MSSSRSGSGAPDRSGDKDLHLLLVSRKSSWGQAVRLAGEQIGGIVSECNARDALTRLAGVGNHYSHLLVDDGDADGLTTALADLTTETAEPETDMLLLGGPERKRPYPRVIRTAEPHAVQEALMTTTPRNRSESAVNLADLRTALDDAMIEIRYQPIIRMADRRPVGLEALARLAHPTLGTLLPDQFVPQLEDAGLAARLTEVVSAQVFADLLSQALAATGLRVSVNFPLDVLLHRASLARLEQQRVAAGIPADRIIIELTESQPVKDLATLRQSVEHLRGLGYGVAIDDAGPAVPRLRPMLDLPFTSVKLDKDLVKQVGASPRIKDFLAATIIDARQRALSVVAEGVETAAIWDLMLAMGTDYAQGFLAARPLPLIAVPIWLEAWNAAPGQIPAGAPGTLPPDSKA